MKIVGTIACAALAAPLLLSLITADEQVAFSVASGTTLEKSFVMTSDLELVSFDMRMDGNPPPMDMDMEMTVTSKQTMEVVDEYGAVTDGKPTKVTRRFATLEGSGTSRTSMAMVGDQSHDIASSSALAGRTVAFTRDGDDYDVKFADDRGGDPELLEGLEEDMDLRGLLPTRPLAIGATYDIEPQRLLSVLAPGGNLRFKADNPAASQMGMGGEQTLADMIGELRGTARGELTAVREIEGRRVAAIRLTIDVDSDHDMTDQMRRMMAESDAGAMGAQMEVLSANVEMTLELTGELLWDLAGGHFHSLDLSGDVGSTVAVEMSVDMMGQSMDIEQTVGMAGKQRLTAKATRR